jgi:hypothetical protein
VINQKYTLRLHSAFNMPDRFLHPDEATVNIVEICYNVINGTEYTGCFIMFSVITNIYNKKPKGPTVMELLTATGKMETVFVTRDIRCVHHWRHGTH